MRSGSSSFGMMTRVDMTRRASFFIAIAALVGAAGCQSGHVDGVQTSTDGQVIVFEDSLYKQLYVADAKGGTFHPGQWSVHPQS